MTAQAQRGRSARPGALTPAAMVCGWLVIAACLARIAAGAP